jgi:D-aminopeptidase
MSKPRLRDLGIVIGAYPPGPLNAITDVAGVAVGHSTVIADEPQVVRTGVTVIVPRPNIFETHAFAGFHRFNGNGEFTGVQWVEEAGTLATPIALTSTHQVGLVRDALVKYEFEQTGREAWALPLVGETYDGWLSDANAHALTEAHVRAALAQASTGVPAEGAVGGGTGMICHEFKGGIGSASRVARTRSGRFTVGALVQANYGDRQLLRVDGVPVGRAIGVDVVESANKPPKIDGSIIVVLTTDAPLLPIQCRRLAQRAVVGLARVGGTGHNGSGDLFLAFSTGNDVPAEARKPVPLHMLPNAQLDPLFDAAAEAVEEAILNALVAADTMTGFKGRTAHALPHDLLVEVMRKSR